MKKIITLITIVVITSAYSFAESGCASKCSGKEAETAQISEEIQTDAGESENTAEEAAEDEKSACGGTKQIEKEKENSELEDKA